MTRTSFKQKLFFQIYNYLSEIKTQAKITYYSRLNEDKMKKTIAKQFKKTMKKELDWENLQTYNEKMQWAKVYDVNSMKTKLTDKYLVREWVQEKIGDKYLIPLLGVWDNVEEIDFALFPEKFVLKTNHASGTNIIVKDKSKLNVEHTKMILKRWLKINYAYTGEFQMHYKDIKPKIIAEQYIEDQNGELNDFKFFCFDGEVYYCWIDVDRYGDHKRNIYNLDWELQPWNQMTYANTPHSVARPDGFEEMVKLAKKLCLGFPHVRVDLYNVDGAIYFGEMTFTNGNGFEIIHPDEYNLMLGNMWNLSINKLSK